MKDCMTIQPVQENTFAYLGKFLGYLISKSSDQLNELIGSMVTDLKQIDYDIVENHKSLMTIALCHNRNSRVVLESEAGFLSVLSERISLHLSKISQGELEDKDARSLIWLLDTLLAMFYNGNEIIRWFESKPGHQFWEPLIRHLCSVSKKHCLSSRYLKLIYSLQRRTVLLFSKILYLSPTNQHLFCDLLVSILRDLQPVLHSNGFLRYLILKLVISEGTLMVHFRNKCDVYILQNTHSLNLRLSAELQEIEHNLLTGRGAVMATKPGSKFVSAAEPHEVDPVTGEDKTNWDWTDYVVQAGKYATLKRQAKTRATKDTQSKKKVQVGPEFSTEFYLKALSDEPLPKSLQFSQLLNLIYEKDPSMLLYPPVLEYTISSGSKQKDSAKESSKWQESSLAHMPSILEIFASKGGLPLLTTLNSKASSTSFDYVVLLSKLLLLPNFSNVFLKDRVKAELLLRLMLGVRETAAGRKYLLISSILVLGNPKSAHFNVHLKKLFHIQRDLIFSMIRDLKPCIMSIQAQFGKFH